MQRNHGLDFLKALCSFMVICIHAPFPGLMGNITIPLTRIAVPLFLMITGYYYSCMIERKNEKKQLTKILRLFAGANCLFFAWSLLKSFLSGDSVITDIGNMFSMKSMLKFVLLNESPFAGHLWYLSAILYVLLIIYVFEKKWDRQKLYPTIPFLLLADIIFGKYSLLIFGQAIPYILVRNFLCVGLPYFLIGDMLYRYKTRISIKKAVLLVFVFACTTILERVILGAYNLNAERDHYISTTFLAISAFLLAVQSNGKRNSKWYNMIYYIGARLSSNIYILHPIFITVIAKAVGVLSNYVQLSMAYSYIAPFVIFIFTTMVSWMLHNIAKKSKMKVYSAKNTNA